jgi:DNA repair exonuclease SbcCD ATPase subunit
LSDEILQGGRVIVVSHQEDVKEKFSHRYLLTKSSEGFVHVQLGEQS